MKPQLFIYIAMRIVILFTLATSFTFLPEQLRPFFGDCPVIEVTRNNDTLYEYCGGIQWSKDAVDPNWGWGARHYWYAWMTAFLFILSLIDLIMGIVTSIVKNYPKLLK